MTAVVLLALIAPPGAQEGESPFLLNRVVGFYADWRRKEFPPRRLPWSRLTHVVHAFALPREDGSIDLSHAGGLDDLVKEARRHDVIPMLSFGGAEGSEPFRKIGLEDTLRKRFVENVVALVAQRGLGGVDIDMESWKTGAKPDLEGGRALLNLLKDLRGPLKERKALLTADVFATEWNGKHVPAEIVDHVDWVNVMAYDATGSWSDQAGPHSSFELARGSLAYWAKRFGEGRKDRIVLGVPFYGRKFAADHRQGGKVETVRYWDLVAMDPGAPGKDRVGGNDFTTYYNGRATLRRKQALVADGGWGGIFIWELSQDAPDPAKALISLFAKRR